MTAMRGFLASLMPGYLNLAGTEMSALLATASKILEDLRASIYAMRRAWVISTATGEALDLHGSDRRTPRVDGESDASYKARLLAVYTQFALAGTESGMERALTAIGFPYADVYPLYKERYNWRPMDGSFALDGSWRFGPVEGVDRYYDFFGPDGPRWASFVVMLNHGWSTVSEADSARVRAVISRMKQAKGKLYGLEGDRTIGCLTTFCDE